jgi:hypothetical protein
MPPEYNFFSDPGHGWVQVPLHEIGRLAIKPSPCSYRDANYGYLEEDCDYALWAEAKQANHEPFTVKEISSDAYSFVRSLPHF